MLHFFRSRSTRCSFLFDVIAVGYNTTAAMAEENAPFTAPTAYNYPEPKATNLQYEQPDEPKNPVVRGLPLYYGASV